MCLKLKYKINAEEKGNVIEEKTQEKGGKH